MHSYHVRVFHNVTPREQRHILDRYQDGERVEEVVQFSYTIGKDDTHENIAEKTFVALNRGAPESPYRAVTKEFDQSKLRSLSTGDLVNVDVDGEGIKTFACDPFGWREVEFPANAVEMEHGPRC